MHACAETYRAHDDAASQLHSEQMARWPTSLRLLRSTPAKYSTSKLQRPDAESSARWQEFHGSVVVFYVLSLCRRKLSTFLSALHREECSSRGGERKLLSKINADGLFLSVYYYPRQPLLGQEQTIHHSQKILVELLSCSIDFSIVVTSSLTRIKHLIDLRIVRVSQ